MTYEDSESLLIGLNSFVKQINDNKIDCFKAILRCKNGFQNVLTWKTFEDAEYCDLKLNLLFCSRNNDKIESQIVEVQFLLKFLLKAKKLGHKYYGIKRRKIFIDSVSNMAYYNESDYSTYRNKILTLINDENINQLSKQLFIKPNIILSMMSDNGKTGHSDVPLLTMMGRTDNFKMYELF